MNLTRNEAIEILKALSRIEGFIMGAVKLNDLEFPSNQIDTCVEMLTSKLDESGAAGETE